MRTHHTLLAVLLTAAPAFAWCAEADVKMESSLSMVVRRPNVGTSVARADVDERKVKEGLMGEMVRHAIVGAMGMCNQMSNLKVAVTDGRSGDFIGGSITRLSGLGLYVNVARTAEHSSGSGSVSPYLSLNLDIASPVAKTVEIRDYERVELYDAEKWDPAKTSTAQLQKVLVPYGERVIAKTLVAAVCGK